MGGAKVWQEALGREWLSPGERAKAREVQKVPKAAERSAAAKKTSLEGCPSGQWEQTVNLPAYAYGGSNPPPSTLDRCARFQFAAGIAQLAERQPSKLNVAGSNPVSRSQADLGPRAGFAGRQFTNPRSSARLLRPRERGRRSSMPPRLLSRSGEAKGSGRRAGQQNRAKQPRQKMRTQCDSAYVAQ